MGNWLRLNRFIMPKGRFLVFISALLITTSVAAIILQLGAQQTSLKSAMKHIPDVLTNNRVKRPTRLQKEVFENESHTDSSSDVTVETKFSTSSTGRENTPTAWKHYIGDFKVTELYDPNSSYLTRLLDDFLTVEIRQVSIFRHGTQFKFRVEFVDGNSAIAKPMRTGKYDYVTYPHWTTFLTDIERHTAEIAAFHLDRLLDFRRVPPCTGRALNFTQDILAKTMDPDILDTQRTKDGAQCIIGGCRSEFCNETALTCARDGLLEVSLCQSVPRAFHGAEVEYPWRPIKHYRWEHKNICDRVKKDRYVRKYGLFLDFMDIAIFDHLLLNYDRHHFIILRNKYSKNETGFVLFDNGKGFGDPFNDDPTFLTPIKQCCQFKKTTYQRVVLLTNTHTRLSDLMRASLSKVPILVLTKDFFPALDRRLGQVLKEMDNCIEIFGSEKVFSMDW